MNGLSFTAQIRQFRRDVIDKHDRVKRGVALRLFRDIIRDTPVLTGRLRGNWQTSLNVPNRSMGSAVDTTGGDAITRATSTVQSSRSADILILTNSLPYVERIEYDGWSHTKAPAGMVRKNVARFATLLGQQLEATRTRI